MDDGTQLIRLPWFPANSLVCALICYRKVHRGAFFQFPFRWFYSYGSNKSTGKETGKTHICALSPPCWPPAAEMTRVSRRLTSASILSMMSKDEWIITEVIYHRCLLPKALSKQEGPNICWDARFLNPFFLNFNQLPAGKKDSKIEYLYKPLVLLILCDFLVISLH